MSASSPHLLELESQTQLLERLELLTHFGSNLITISGAPGSGKSWLAQRYLEVFAQNKDQVLLMARPTHTATSQRVMIFSQLFADPYLDPQESLLDSFSQLTDDEVVDIVIAIDDAQHLDDFLIAECWEWVLAAQQNPNWTVNVLLFAIPATVEKMVGRLMYGQDHKPIELEVEPLSEMDARHFFESLVVKYVDRRVEKKVRNEFKTVVPLPGDIMALGEISVEKKIIIRSIIGSPLNLLLIALLLLAIAGGSAWWLWQQPNAEQQAEQILNSLEQTAIPSLDSSDSQDEQAPQSEPEGQSATESASLTQGDRELQWAQEQGIADDSSALPPSVVGSEESVGSDDGDKKRVVINADVVDALLGEESAPASEQSSTEASVASEADSAIGDSVESQPADTQADQASPEDSKVDSADATGSESPEGSEGQDARSADASEAAPNAVRFSYAREALMALPGKHYTLQLAALQSPQEVQRFLDTHQVASQVRIYPTVRNEKTWYIITYQDYPTIQLARDAVSTLPASLRAAEPWAKSLRQVQREIERAK
ncbi:MULTISPECIES: AAA family ATPase [unclassified Vibrio]|uniref:AAA family ATPase n=1 Tax=Vibrio sp. HB236076 TaxID=3232307 RepID=A0AB39HEH9_9VIBR|nr:AAA family ATPase [Vibrio sp. HB161653]MDP5255760.1 AAA family ATPase [Vibrio sp. HB161653]